MNLDIIFIIFHKSWPFLIELGGVREAGQGFRLKLLLLFLTCQLDGDKSSVCALTYDYIAAVNALFLVRKFNICILILPSSTFLYSKLSVLAKCSASSVSIWTAKTAANGESFPPLILSTISSEFLFLSSCVIKNDCPDNFPRMQYRHHS